MKKIFWPTGIIVILLTCLLSGCQEQEATSTNNFENIEFESDVFELINGSLDFVELNNVIIRAEAKYMFKNIADRNVYGVKVIAEFYDKDNNLIYTGGPKNFSLPIGYTETGLSPANVISYTGDRVKEVDYVRILAFE
jgi:hypothetical protein